MYDKNDTLSQNKWARCNSLPMLLVFCLLTNAPCRSRSAALSLFHSFEFNSVSFLILFSQNKRARCNCLQNYKLFLFHFHQLFYYCGLLRPLMMTKMMHQSDVYDYLSLYEWLFIQTRVCAWRKAHMDLPFSPSSTLPALKTMSTRTSFVYKVLYRVAKSINKLF